MSVEEQTDETETAVAEHVERVEHEDDAVQQDAESAQIERVNRHRAVLMRGVVTPSLGLLAVALIVLGVLNATIWKPSRVITATAQVASSRYIVTDANVEGLVDSHVEVDVEATHSSTVCVALASSKDAIGWLGSDAYTRLTGLVDWETLSVEKVAARSDSSRNASNEDDENSVAFRDSDMWRAVKCGKGKASIKTQETNPTDVVLIDISKAADADVSFTWTRQVLPDFAMPLYLVGGLLVGAAVLSASVFAMPPSRRRKRVVVRSVARRASDASAEAAKVTVGEAVLGSLSWLVSVLHLKPKRRRRHAAGRTGADGSQPTIVDPSSRNMVADASGQTYQSSADMPGGISPEELQEYFARLVQEIADLPSTVSISDMRNETEKHLDVSDVSSASDAASSESSEESDTSAESTGESGQSGESSEESADQSSESSESSESTEEEEA